MLSRADYTFQGMSAYLERDWDKMSLSGVSTARREHGSTLDQFSYLIKELGAPDRFLEVVNHLIGHSKGQGVDENKEKEKVLMDDIMDFISEAFLRCTCHADLIVFAIDDVQYMDKMSWKVVRRIFETGKNVLIFCGSRPLDSYKPIIESDFWKDLVERFKGENRFFETELGPLEQHDITELMSKCLSCQPTEIDEGLCNEVFKQSGGMPHFASELLTRLKEENLCKRLENGKIGWRNNDGKNMDVSRLQYECNACYHRLAFC